MQFDLLLKSQGHCQKIMFKFALINRRLLVKCVYNCSSLNGSP